MVGAVICCASRVEPPDHGAEAVGGQIAGDGQHPIAYLHGHGVAGVGPEPGRVAGQEDRVHVGDRAT